jgi:hypothetical protein
MNLTFFFSKSKAAMIIEIWLRYLQKSINVHPAHFSTTRILFIWLEKIFWLFDVNLAVCTSV